MVLPFVIDFPAFVEKRRRDLMHVSQSRIEFSRITEARDRDNTKWCVQSNWKENVRLIALTVVPSNSSICCIAILLD